MTTTKSIFLMQREQIGVRSMAFSRTGGSTAALRHRDLLAAASADDLSEHAVLMFVPPLRKKKIQPPRAHPLEATGGAHFGAWPNEEVQGQSLSGPGPARRFLNVFWSGSKRRDLFRRLAKSSQSCASATRLFRFDLSRAASATFNAAIARYWAGVNIVLSLGLGKALMA
jgi:hypothetical protein